MFGVGATELLVILALALVVLGPSRLPDAATRLGQAIRAFRRAIRGVQARVEAEPVLDAPLAELRSALRDEPAQLPQVAPGSQVAQVAQVAQVSQVAQEVKTAARVSVAARRAPVDAEPPKDS